MILEIGTYCGRSAVVELRGALSNPDRTVPPQFFGINIAPESIPHTIHTLESFNLLDNVLLFKGAFEAFLEKFPVSPTMVFVDGDHRYEAVRDDIKNLSRILAPGIPVLFHDYLNPENDTGEYGVRRAAMEWEDEGYAVFIGAFGCSGLFLTGGRCAGEIKPLSQELFIESRDKLMHSYKNVRQSHEKATNDQLMSENQRCKNFNSWLGQFKEKDGIRYISETRKFAHDENKYDEQYNIDPVNTGGGKGLVALLRDLDAPFEGPALEIGCGTGYVSVGLVQENAYPITFLTDPSVAFLEIVKGKLDHLGLNMSSVHLGVLSAERIDILPEDTFSLIVLSSTLHHVLYVSKFIREAAHALSSGGILAFKEPCHEGFVIMGTMAQFVIPVLESKGVKITKKHRSQLASFIDVMKFYCRQDVDKASAEDKHVFRVDKIMKEGQSAGLTVDFLPNREFEDYLAQPLVPLDKKFFYYFFKDYLKYCMSFDAELLDLLDANFFNDCPFIEEISSGGNDPYMHGVFICKKF